VLNQTFVAPKDFRNAVWRFELRNFAIFDELHIGRQKRFQGWGTRTSEEKKLWDIG